MQQNVKYRRNVRKHHFVDNNKFMCEQVFEIAFYVCLSKRRIALASWVNRDRSCWIYLEFG